MSKFNIDPSQTDIVKLLPSLLDNPQRDFIIVDKHDALQALEYDLPSFGITQKQEYLIVGSKFNDRITLDKYNDTADGGAGNDEIFGNNGNDVLFGNTGHDSLFGGAGNDLVRGGAGNDLLTGDAGNDTVHGGAGNDIVVFEGGGTDVAYMGDGNDYASVSTYNKYAKIFLGDGADGAFVSAAHSSVFGDGGNDSIFVANQSIVANGGAGNDLLEAGRAFVNNDYLGNDITMSDLSTRLTGGAGADTFTFNFNTSATITDFTRGQDKIDFSNLADLYGKITFKDITSVTVDTGELIHLNISMDLEGEDLTGPSILLENFKGTLTASDFDFTGYFG